jgi:hypothetical protein
VALDDLVQRGALDLAVLVRVSRAGARSPARGRSARRGRVCPGTRSGVAICSTGRVGRSSVAWLAHQEAAELAVRCSNRVSWTGTSSRWVRVPRPQNPQGDRCRIASHPISFVDPETVPNTSTLLNSNAAGKSWFQPSFVDRRGADSPPGSTQ